MDHIVSLYRTLHWLVDVPVGLISGSYRVGHFTTRPSVAEQHTNAHYIRPTQEVIANIGKNLQMPMPDALYPVFYWVQRAIVEEARNSPTQICDWGGGYAVLFSKFKQYMHYPFNLTVIEIDELVKHALSIPELKDVKFESTTVQVPSIDILHTNGTMQVAADEFMEFLRRHKPKWTIISGMEGVLNEPTFYSTQVLRSSSRRALYKTHNIDEFVGKVERCGYEKIDMWIGDESRSGVFLRRIKPVHSYGFAFKRLN
jgi:putative methyltransferase (TIGR04325 family)